MDMSFFYFIEKLREPKVIWCAGFFFALSCAIAHQMALRFDVSEETKVYSYSLQYEGKIPCLQENLVLEEKKGTAGNVDGLYARYALLMDADNRRVLFEKDGYKEAPMASTTKIMTLLVTLEQANLEDIVTISDYAASMPDVQLNIRAGEQYRLCDLLYSLMLESHNDTAVAIAEHVGGSVEGFAALMNEKAKELGANHTHFVTPNGLDEEEHYTTAYDLALIASYAIENETFLQIIQTPSYSFHEQTTGRSFTVNNKDRFLTSYEGAIGIKTGFTGNAGYCFVGAVNREGKKLVSVVLACGWPPHKNYKWQDTTKLMEYGMDNYEKKEVLIPNTTFQQLLVSDSIEGEPVTPYNRDSISLLLRSDEKITFDVELPERLQAPVKAGETIGKITVKIDNQPYKIVPLYARESRGKITYSYVLRKIVTSYFLVMES